MILRQLKRSLKLYNPTNFSFFGLETLLIRDKNLRFADKFQQIKMKMKTTEKNSNS